MMQKGEKEEVKSRCVLTRLNRRNDHLETEYESWQQLADFLPLPPHLWMPFYGSGKCARDMAGLGFHDVIHEKGVDFFKCTPPPPRYLLVDNPPFSLRRQILQRLVGQKRSFILILPLPTLGTRYMSNIMKEEGRDFKVIIPPSRMRFSGKKASPPFACVYLCYRCAAMFPQEQQSNQLIYM